MSRAWTSDGVERGDLGAFGTSYAASANNSSQITGTYSVGISSGGGFIRSPMFAANSEVFAQARYKWSSLIGFSGSPGGIVMSFLSGSSVADYITLDSSLILRAVRGDGTVLATASTALPTNAANTYLIAVHLLVNATTGVFEVRVDGVSYISVSGVNTVANSVSTINTVEYTASQGGGVTQYTDDFLVNINDSSGAEDSWAQDIRIARIGPSAAGSNTGLTPTSGNNYANVQAVPPSNSNTTYNYTNTSGDYDDYAPGSATPTIPSGATIVGVAVDAQAETLNSPQNAKLHIYTGSTDYASGSIALPTSYGRISNRWRINPNTGAAWTLSEAEAAQPGIGLA